MYEGTCRRRVQRVVQEIRLQIGETARVMDAKRVRAFAPGLPFPAPRHRHEQSASSGSCW